MQSRGTPHRANDNQGETFDSGPNPRRPQGRIWRWGRDTGQICVKCWWEVVNHQGGKEDHKVDLGEGLVKSHIAELTSLSVEYWVLA